MKKTDNLQKCSMLFSKMEIIFNPTIFTSRIKFSKIKIFDDIFFKSCPELQSFRLSKKTLRDTQGGRVN